MNTKPIRTDLESDSPSDEQKSEHLELPKPDSENITVFTHNLPNKPILPWNRYDSPWQETEEKQDENEQNQSEQVDKADDRANLENLESENAATETDPTNN
jgi:hypothetical protein